jgi:hypothetical protein
MKKKQAVSILLLALICFAMMGQTLGQTRVSGVNENDFFTYIIKAYWNSSNSQAIVPEDLIRLNSTRAYNVTVSRVKGLNVTTEEVWRLGNGTDSPAIVVQDLSSGNQYLMLGLIREDIVSANLGVNDLLYSTGNDPRRINETVTIDYGNVNRATNIVTFSYPITNDPNIVVGNGYTTDYFDKDTGALVGRREDSITSGENTILVVTLVDTNRWSITAPSSIVTPTPTETTTANSPTSGFVELFGLNVPVPLLAGAVIAVAIIVAVPLVFFKTRKGKKKRFRR